MPIIEYAPESFKRKTKTKTFADTPYLQLKEDYTILLDCTDGNVTVELLPAKAMYGQILNVKKIDSSPNVGVIEPNGVEEIDNFASINLETQWASLTIQSNGTSWFIL